MSVTYPSEWDVDWTCHRCGWSAKAGKSCPNCGKAPRTGEEIAAEMVEWNRLAIAENAELVRTWSPRP